MEDSFGRSSHSHTLLAENSYENTFAEVSFLIKFLNPCQCLKLLYKSFEFLKLLHSEKFKNSSQVYEKIPTPNQWRAEA